MDKVIKTISSVIGTITGITVGLKLMEFVRSDKCLDLGGYVTSWGACQFDGERAEMLSISVPIIVLIVFVAVVITLVVGFLLNLAGNRIGKT